jgi:phosphoglycolate phosphatase-like HAD superfamily hydrolase
LQNVASTEAADQSTLGLQRKALEKMYFEHKKPATHNVMKLTMIKSPISADAILWDFDGTLVNSAAKNIDITKEILARVAPRLTGDNLPSCLQNEAEYLVANHGADHWRELYRDYFGMNLNEIETAGPLWESYQMRNQTPVSLFDGVVDAVTRLSGSPQGICSANASNNIRKVLNDHDIEDVFQSVVGYEELPNHHQKPAPDGGLKCLQEIFGQVTGKTIVYIGDHVADVMFSRGLAERLCPSNNVISIIVTYSGANPGAWKEQPDIVVEHPSALLDWIKIVEDTSSVGETRESITGVA